MYLHSRLYLSLTLLGALLLTFLPLPEWTLWLRPLWVPLVFCYWAQAFPEHVSVGVGFALGLLMDLLLGTLLGVHALLLTLLSFVITKIHKRWRMFPPIQQASIIFVLFLTYLFIQYWIHGLLGRAPGTWKYWLPALTSALLWPVVNEFLSRFQRRFRVSMR